MLDAREGTPAPHTGSGVTSWRPSMNLRPVERYGRFEVLGRIGRGGMAEILLARERFMAGGTRHLVIKRILPEIADDAEMLRMFLDEARVVMGLSHPNLCQIYDVGEQDGTWYIAMEWVNGTTLHQLIKRAIADNNVDAAVMARVIGQCAEALHHAHTARDAEGRLTGLVHRDVSPHNIMVAYDGRVKLLDFGIAKTVSSTHRTEAGVVKGKVCYMAPEQWLSDPLDGRTDVFALGACLVEALTGEIMFKRDTQMEVMRAILDGTIPEIALHNPKAPPALIAIAERALARNPQDRYQTALEMSLAIERFLASLPEPCGAASVAEYTRALLPAEVELGPVLERSVHGAHLPAAPPLLLPPVPRGLLGAARSTPIASLPVPRPFQSRPMATFRDSGRDDRHDGSHDDRYNDHDDDAITPVERPPAARDASFDSDEAARLLERQQRLVARLTRTPSRSFQLTNPTVIDDPSPFDDAPTHQRAILPSAESSQRRSPLPQVVPAAHVSNIATPPPLPAPEAGASEERPSFESLVARPLARTLSLPVVRSIGRITSVLVPAAAAMLMFLYWGLSSRDVETAGAPRPASPDQMQVTESKPAAIDATPRTEAEAPMAAAPKQRATETKAPAQPATPALEAGSGLLSINTRPWSTVYLGKRMLGTTPIARVPVPNTTLTLKLVDRDGRVHLRRIARSEADLREIFFDFE